MTDTVFCGACGAQLATEARFCASCGASQDAFEADVQPNPTVADPPAGRARDAGGGAQEVSIGAGSTAKVRSFWVGFALSLLTLGIYGLFWYYFVNDELKDVGEAKGDGNLAQSNPMMSVAAIFIGGWLILPPFLSVYNYGQRIKRAERLGGIPPERQISPTVAFLLYFPGMFLVIPYFAHFWYVTKHQNIALRANSQPTPTPAPAAT